MGRKSFYLGPEGAKWSCQSAAKKTLAPPEVFLAPPRGGAKNPLLAPPRVSSVSAPVYIVHINLFVILCVLQNGIWTQFGFSTRSIKKHELSLFNARYYR